MCENVAKRSGEDGPCKIRRPMNQLVRVQFCPCRRPASLAVTAGLVMKAGLLAQFVCNSSVHHYRIIHIAFILQNSK